MGGQAARKMKLGFGAATGFTILVLALIGGVVGWIHTRDKIEHKVGTGSNSHVAALVLKLRACQKTFIFML